MEEYPKVFWTDSGSDYAIYRQGSNDPAKVPIVPAMQDPFDIKVDHEAGKIYWSDLAANKILRANLDGSELETLIAGEDPYFIDLDVEAGMIYWTTQAPGGIYRAKIFGPSPQRETVVPAGARARDLMLDVHGGKVYWTSAFGTVSYADFKEFSPTWQNLLTGLGDIWGITMDIFQGMVYWVSGGPAGRIRRRSILGGATQTLPPVLNHGRGITIDMLAGRLYWAESGGQRILHSDYNGQNIASVPLGGRHPASGLAWDPLAGQLYWPGADGRVYSKSIPGGNFLTLAYPTSPPAGIAVDSAEKRIYWIQKKSPPHMLSVNLEGKELRQLNYAGPVDRHLSLRTAPDEILWQEATRVMRANRQGDNSNTVFSNLRSPHHIVYHSTLNRLFWLDTREFVSGSNTFVVHLIRILQIGGGVPAEIVSNSGEFLALAVDGQSGQVFWAMADGIYRADTDGDGQDRIIVRQRVSNLAVDEERGKLYWSEGNAPNASIRRSNLDGSGEELLISGISPVSFALEFES